MLQLLPVPAESGVVPEHSPAGGNPAVFNDEATFSWLRMLARRGVQIGAVSGGPYILARAGLLDGYRCTIHWEHLPGFLEEFPRLAPSRVLYEIDRERMTCAGGIAALDMMRALITRDLGPAAAAAVSEWFLQTQLRSGGGPQRLTLRERYGTGSPRLLAVLKFMESRLGPALAAAGAPAPSRITWVPLLAYHTLSE